jgi:hypothetical protein
MPKPQETPILSFHEELSNRLQRSLSADEERIAKAVDQISRHALNGDGFSPALLEPVVGKLPESLRQNLRLWDEAPQSPWQTWLYIIHFLENVSLPIPPAFREATDWAEVAGTGGIDRAAAVNHALARVAGSS